MAYWDQAKKKVGAATSSIKESIGSKTRDIQGKSASDRAKGLMMGGVAGAAVGQSGIKKGIKSAGKKLKGAFSGLAGPKMGTYDVNEGAFTDTGETERLKALFKQRSEAAGGRTAPTAQAAQIAMGPQEGVRGRQMSLASALEQQAAGQGPSLAQSQLDRATGQNIAQAMALAASQRGQTAGQGLRQIAQQTQSAQEAAARDAATLRIQEQMQARQQLGDVLQGTRGQDIGLATSQAGLQQQAALANQQAALQQQQISDAMQKFYDQQRLGATQFDQQRLMDLEKLKAGQTTSANQLAMQQRAQNMQMISGLAGAGASAFAASDERQKKKIKKLTPEKVSEFINALSGYTYEYKDPNIPGGGEGEQMSPMAQDLEKSEIGRDMVMEGPTGKVVDYGKASGAMLATAAMLNDRMTDLEKAFKARKGRKNG